MFRILFSVSLQITLFCFSGNLLAGNIKLTKAKISNKIAVENPEIYPLSEIKEGLEGYGYTVYRSVDGPQKFSFKVLGIMKGYLGAGEDLIIAELIGKQIEETGVISGMSGSPVYVGHRLVGAVSYRFGQFTKKAIAGITPIESMLKIADSPKKLKTKINASRKQPMTTKWGHAEAIRTAIWSDSLSPKVFEAFKPFLEKRGYHLNPENISAFNKNKSKMQSRDLSRFYASGPIASALVSGDINMVGIGTVTWVNNDRFLAFGHPFLSLGESTMPVGNAEIIVTVPSAAGSWKMGQMTGVTGHLEDDRLHAIGGVMGVTPLTIPMDIDYKLEGPRQQKDAQSKVHLEVSKFPDSTLYAAMSLAQSLSERVNVEQGGSYYLSGEVVFNNDKRLAINEKVTFESGTSGFMVLAFGFLDKIEQMTRNPWQKVEMHSVSLRVERQKKVNSEKIIAVEVIDAIKQGYTTTIEVTFDKFREGMIKRQYVVSIPRVENAGEYKLAIFSKAKAIAFEQVNGLSIADTSIDDRLERLNIESLKKNMSIYLIKEEDGRLFAGHSLANFPKAYQNIISPYRGDLDSNIYKRVQLLQEVDWRSELNGGVEISIILRKNTL